MESYLNDYCKFISSLKKYPSINDTEEYISNSSFDVNEVLNRFEKHINIQNIFNLIESKSFYSGHRKKEKISLLIQFFNILHTYSKNLLINYDLYSSKSIQETNANIKDCMVYIPDYMGYLSNLIGYCYNSDKREWSITFELNNGTKLRLAAVCILSSHAHQILSAMKNETNFSKDSDESPSKLNKENLKPTDTKWTCDVCSFTNNQSDLNCSVCFNPNNTPVDKPDKKLTSSKQFESNRWKCEICSFLNDEANQICEVCQRKSMSFKPLDCDRTVNKLNRAGKNLSKSFNSKGKYAQLVWSDVDAKPHQPRNTKASKQGIDQQITNSKLCHYASVAEFSNFRNYKWTCDKCTFLNDQCDSICQVCLGVKDNSLDKITYKRTERVLKPKNNQEELLTGNEYNWQCRECLSFNKPVYSTCQICNLAKRKIIPDNKKPETPSTTEIATKNEIRPNEHVRGIDKLKYQISNPVKQSKQVIMDSISQKGQWECDKCMLINNERDSICKACLNGKNNSVDTNFNENTKLVLKTKNNQEELFTGNEYNWQCRECLSFNKTVYSTCQICNLAKQKIIPDNKKPKTPSTTKFATKNEIRPNEHVRDINKLEYQISNPKNNQEELLSKKQSYGNGKQCSCVNNTANNTCNICNVARKNVVSDEKHPKIPINTDAFTQNEIRRTDSSKPTNKPQNQGKKVPQKNTANKMPNIVKHSHKYTVSSPVKRHVNESSSQKKGNVLEKAPEKKTTDKVKEKRSKQPFQKMLSVFICGARR